MGKNIDWTVTSAGGIGVLLGALQVGVLPATIGNIDLHGSLMLTAGLFGVILLATRSNLL